MNLTSADIWTSRIARSMALLGGLVLLLLTLLTCVSIVGRGLVTFAYSSSGGNYLEWLSQIIITLGAGPVPGDFELVESGIAFCVFAFFPWCQINRKHASVDIFARSFPDPVNRFIDLVSEVLMSAVLLLMAWRLWAGMADKMRYDETTYILQFPVWWSYAASAAAASIAAFVSCYLVWVRLREMKAGQLLLPADGKADPGDLAH